MHLSEESPTQQEHRIDKLTQKAAFFFFLLLLRRLVRPQPQRPVACPSDQIARAADRNGGHRRDMVVM